MKKHYYKLGVLLIILASIDYVIIGILAYGDYILWLIGIIFIMLSNQKIWIKILTSILLPIIVTYVIIFTMLG